MKQLMQALQEWQVNDLRHQAGADDADCRS
jgi:hypothetical protein